MDQWSEGALKAWFYAAVAAVALIGFWFNLEPYACPIPESLLNSEDPKQPPCFEFWFNRYQTFIAALLALSSAGLAWIGTQRQVKTAERTAEISRAQLTTSLLPQFREQKSTLQQLLMVSYEFDRHLSTMRSAINNLDEHAKRWKRGALNIHFTLASREVERARTAFDAAFDGAEKLILADRDISGLDLNQQKNFFDFIESATFILQNCRNIRTVAFNGENFPGKYPFDIAVFLQDGPMLRAFYTDRAAILHVISRDFQQYNYFVDAAKAAISRFVD